MRLGDEFWSSPVRAADTAFVFGKGGVAASFDLTAEEFAPAAKTTLIEGVWATPALAGGGLVLRTEHTLRFYRPRRRLRRRPRMTAAPLAALLLAAPPAFPEVPADVFFADPLAVFADDTPLPGAAPRPAATAPATTAPAMTGPRVTGGPVDAEAAGGSEEDAPPNVIDWAALLPPDQLDAEVRTVIETLTEKSRDVQTYNNAYLSIPPAAAELAALFAVGGREGVDVPWKSVSGQLALKAAQITESDLRRGAGGQKQVADPLKTLDALLNGGGRGDGEPVEFATAADFNLLMKRFQAGVDSLKALASSPQLLEANRPAVEREARVLAVLSAVSGDESHGWGIDEEFLTLSQAMTMAASETATAAGGDFDDFDAARRSLSQTCSNCHGQYRN